MGAKDGGATSHDPALTRDGLLTRLRDRNAPGALLERVAGDRRFTRHAEIRRALVLHPHTPLARARTLVAHLGWRDLVEVASDPRVHPVIRRSAESYLEARIGEMTLGERVALARRASRPIVALLAASEDEGVLRALLGNPFMVERLVVNIASSSTAPALLRDLAAHVKWSTRRAVRLAVAENPRAPVATALRSVESLDPRDLRRLSRDGRVPTIVRIAAARRLQA